LSLWEPLISPGVYWRMSPESAAGGDMAAEGGWK
jgi:hypothetical protein